jgi:transposase
LRESLLQAALALPTCVRQWAAPKAWAMAVAERRGLRRAITAVARKFGIVCTDFGL